MQHMLGSCFTNVEKTESKQVTQRVDYIHVHCTSRMLRAYMNGGQHEDLGTGC